MDSKHVVSLVMLVLVLVVFLVAAPPLFAVAIAILAGNKKVRETIGSKLRQVGANVNLNLDRGASTEGGNEADRMLRRMRQEPQRRREVVSAPMAVGTPPPLLVQPGRTFPEADEKFATFGGELFADCESYADYFQRDYYRAKDRGGEIYPWDLPPEVAPWER